MSEFELVILLREYGGAISEQFNFWMATTFAVVIASYTAGHKLNNTVRALILVLYIVACAVFYMRYLGAVRAVEIISGQLGDMNSDFGPRVVPWASLGRKFVMIVGTIFAATVVLRPSLTADEQEPQRPGG
ncbi:MAG: hypothetical protein GWN47_04200 [Woeseiaceae bacterium]|nr:hypothetical protein [Woeseiaceae bacterium]